MTSTRDTTDDALYAPIEWKRSGDYGDISYDTAEGIAKITICRPEVRNAFRPQTLFELSHAFNDARDDSEIGVVILTGRGDEAFCSGGDQRVRGQGGYVGSDGVPRLNVLDLQRQIRTLPKPVIAMLLAVAFLGERITAPLVAGGTVIFTGVYLTERG